VCDLNSLPKTVTRQRRGCGLNPGLLRLNPLISRVLCVFCATVNLLNIRTQRVTDGETFVEGGISADDDDQRPTHQVTEHVC